MDLKSLWRLSSVRSITLLVGAISHSFALAKAIDRYVQARSEERDGTIEKIDQRLQDIIKTIFDRCIAEGEYKQVSHSCLPLFPLYDILRGRQLASRSNRVVSTLYH